MKHDEVLKKYGYPLFFYVGDTFVNTCGNVVKIVTVEKENLKISCPSGIYDYKPLDILERLIDKSYKKYKQPFNEAMAAQTQRFNLPIDEKISKKLCYYIGAEYSDDLKGLAIYDGNKINKKFERIKAQNCSMEYIKAVLAELPDVDITDNKFLDYVPSLNFKERNMLLDLAIELANLEPSERLKKTISNIYTVFESGLYDKLPGNDLIEKAKNFLNDRYIEFDCGNKANILLNKWSIEWKEEEKNSKEFTEGLGKYATTMNPCREDEYALLKFKEKRDIKKLDENLLLLL